LLRYRQQRQRQARAASTDGDVAIALDAAAGRLRMAASEGWRSHHGTTVGEPTPQRRSAAARFGLLQLRLAVRHPAARRVFLHPRATQPQPAHTSTAAASVRSSGALDAKGFARSLAKRTL